MPFMPTYPKPEEAQLMQSFDGRRIEFLGFTV